MAINSDEQIRQAVQQKYAEAARRVLARTGAAASCCGPTNAASCCSTSAATDPGRLYDAEHLSEVPEAAAEASLGCGNPVLLSDIRLGETVLDLGSGGGIDVLLSARRVGATGKAYGLDMTDEMLELARNNAATAGVSNVEFLKGHIEAIPLPDASVDVIISNCVVNLSPDKDAVLNEAYRVLRPGGRFTVADIVVQGGALSPAIRQALALWAGCISGALQEEEYRSKLAAAGFGDIEMTVLKEYNAADVRETDCDCFPAGLQLDPGVKIVSAFVRAIKSGK
jgi:arsenite methyltransferase